MIDDLPVLAVCGWSGSGKTTLMEQLLARLAAEGLAVAVVKQEASRIDLDRPGKDSDRLFRAGADVLLRGPNEELLRARPPDWEHLHARLRALAATHDVILMEGGKSTDLPKLWLLAEGQTHPPNEVSNVLAALPGGDSRLEQAWAIAAEHLAARWLATPLCGCVLFGGASSRMGRPKHLLLKDGRTWLERTVNLLRPLCRSVVLAGAGQVPEGLADCPHLPDAPDAKGPMAGILAAMRWAPSAGWLVAACDLPDASDAALRWLLTTRRAGTWAALPRLAPDAPVEPLLAHYDFRSRSVLEHQAAAGDFRLSRLASCPKVACPVVPAALAGAWRNVNTPADLDRGDTAHDS